MSKLISIILILLTALLTSLGLGTGIDMDQIIKTPIKNGASTGNRGTTVNKIPFTTITDYSTLPQKVQVQIDELKSKSGFYLFDNKEYGIDEEGYHLFLNLGEKNTSGYAVKVNHVEDNEGVTVIYIEEFAPEKDAMTLQVISYPNTVVKFKNTTPNIKVVSDKGTIYNDLSLNK